MFDIDKEKTGEIAGFPAGIYLLKVNNKTLEQRTRCEIFSKLTIKTEE